MKLYIFIFCIKENSCDSDVMIFIQIQSTDNLHPDPTGIMSAGTNCIKPQCICIQIFNPVNSLHVLSKLLVIT